MRVFVSGVSCVGKTTVGVEVARLLGCRFLDLDAEAERAWGMPIAAIQAECSGMDAYRKRAAAVQSDLVEATAGDPCVIALPPSGLIGPCWLVVRRSGGVTVVLTDTPGNILKRIAFYDERSRRIERTLTPREERLCLREIRKDLAWFGRGYRKADVTVDLGGMPPMEAAERVAGALRARAAGGLLPAGLPAPPP